jgi:hypothetical protein
MDRGSAQQFPYSAANSISLMEKSREAVRQTGNLHLMPFKDNFFTPCKEASARTRPFAAQREGVEQAKKRPLSCFVVFLF